MSHHHHSGALTIRPICAKLTRDTEAIGRMDPYCEIHIGSQKAKTSVANEAGKTPSWNDEITFHITNEETVRIAVWDYDSTSANDIVGEVELPLQNLLLAGVWEDWIEIYHHGNKAGEVKIASSFNASHGGEEHHHHHHHHHN